VRIYFKRENQVVLYMVECRFNDPARESAWNDWYGGERLGELLAVPGFLTSQRFIALTRPGNYYLTVHSLESMMAFQTPEYKAMGGGAFKGFQGCITDWVRRFFNGVEVAPSITPNDRLVITDAPPEALKGCPVPFVWMDPIEEKDKSRVRGLAKISLSEAEDLLPQKRWPLDVYSPMINQRLST
jgi:hypothetical protein